MSTTCKKAGMKIIDEIGGLLQRFSQQLNRVHRPHINLLLLKSTAQLQHAARTIHCNAARSTLFNILDLVTQNLLGNVGMTGQRIGATKTAASISVLHLDQFTPRGRQQLTRLFQTPAPRLRWQES